MTQLKDLFIGIDSGSEEPSGEDGAVEVYADSVKQALELAARELGIDITLLDYEILEKGTSGIFGIGRQPYHVLITPTRIFHEHADLEEIEKKIASEHVPGIHYKEKEDADSEFKIRVTRSGINLIVTPPRGRGVKIDSHKVTSKLLSMRITKYDMKAIEKEVKNPTGNPLIIGEWKPHPEYDSVMRVEVSEDEMTTYVHFKPPRYFGRHYEYEEVIDDLKGAGVVSGIKHDEIRDYLNEMNYNRPLLAAQGIKPRNGRDAYIDYKVRVEKSRRAFEEDESGKVDFRNLELLENVVVGQLLAVKVPAEKGVAGRTVTNRILPTKPGKDIPFPYGKGTILSEDGTELTAETNGQVVFKAGKIHVEPVHVVNGDVSLSTGNIVFLGSVIVQGSVQDNFIVKAAGNIEVKGTVQKAFLESEGDIIVHQGISGRDEAKIESTGGNIFAKFIQNAYVSAEMDIVVPEGVIHSRLDSGDSILCTGRRARIVGGVIRAGNEVNTRLLGAEVSTKTEVKVGINPKVLQQMEELAEIKENITGELHDMELNLKNLETQKKTQKKLSEEKEQMLTDLRSQNERLKNRLSDVSVELEELNSYISMLEHKGKVNVEKAVYPGVDIYIKDKKFSVKDEYNHIKFTLEGDEIRLSDYEPLNIQDKHKRLSTLVKRR